jgi:hypothetical protein
MRPASGQAGSVLNAIVGSDDTVPKRPVNEKPPVTVEPAVAVAGLMDSTHGAGTTVILAWVGLGVNVVLSGE